MTHTKIIPINGEYIQTLEDILPEKGPLDILIIGKTPSPCSVMKGHYFQGKQGQRFWKLMTDEYGIMDVDEKNKNARSYDNCLINNNMGITDIVKVPFCLGDEPDRYAYEQGLIKLQEKIEYFKPKVLIFFYKKVLVNILRIKKFDSYSVRYGFNEGFPFFENIDVFVYPAAGAGSVSKPEITEAMSSLRDRYGIQNRKRARDL